MSWMIGTSATPARRAGLVAQNSTSQRLWARAPAKAQRRVGDLPGGEPGAERRRLLAGDRVAVGEDHLAGDAVGVELLVADRRGRRRRASPSAFSPSHFSTYSPLTSSTRRRWLWRSATHSSNCGWNCGVEVLAVLLDLEAGVGVRRHDHVRRRCWCRRPSSGFGTCRSPRRIGLARLAQCARLLAHCYRPDVGAASARMATRSRRQRAPRGDHGHRPPRRPRPRRRRRPRARRWSRRAAPRRSRCASSPPNSVSPPPPSTGTSGSRDELVIALDPTAGRAAGPGRRSTASIPRDRVTSAARNIWLNALGHRNVTSLANQVGATTLLELPLEVAMAAELEAAGVRGADARDAMRAILMCIAGFLVVAWRRDDVAPLEPPPRRAVVRRRRRSHRPRYTSAAMCEPARPSRSVRDDRPRRRRRVRSRQHRSGESP